jgi:protein tyrosine/serine phosphatase
LKSNIYWIPTPWAGRLAILARPRGNDWLNDEVQGWRDAGVEVVVSLLGPDEELELGLSDEARLVQAESLRFINFPIDDYGVPASQAALHELVKKVEHLLDCGKTVGIHCRAGIGRSSLVAACLLVSGGQGVEASFEQIQKARGVPVPDTVNQRAWVADFALSSLSASR